MQLFHGIERADDFRMQAIGGNDILQFLAYKAFIIDDKFRAYIPQQINNTRESRKGFPFVVYRCRNDFERSSVYVIKV
jgi:hypothetical protein